MKRLTFEEVASRVLTNKISGPEHGEPEEDTPSSHPAARSSAAGAPASEARAPDSVPAAPASTASAGAEPTSKRQRVLKLMTSEEVAQPEEHEATVLEDLINKIKKAAKAKLMYSDESTCASTEHFRCTQVLAAMSVAPAPASAASAPDGEDHKTNLVKRHFLGFLLRLLYSARCYRDLKHFVPILEGLVAVGCCAPANIRTSILEIRRRLRQNTFIRAPI